MPEIPDEWLQERFTPDTAGFVASQEYWDTWQQLVAKMQAGDELWYFESPVETWEKMGGRAGYVIIRAGRQVHVEVTAMN